MKLSDALASQPPARSIPGARLDIRKALDGSRTRLVVIDDDPTGTQTVYGVKVYTVWSVDRLRKAMASGQSVFYISTNSRSLSTDRAVRLSLEVAGNLRTAAEGDGADVILASRSDSTLRGHFPHEVDALTSGLGQEVDGVIVVPAFFEGGRYTIGDVHWVDQHGELVSADQTEFARDPVFGYKHADLKLWVEEKTGGAARADKVRSISLETIRRGGPDAVADELARARERYMIVVNAACYEDLEVFVLGLVAAESQGKRFVYRCAASFVKVRGGFSDGPPLEHSQMEPGPGPGLVIVGSYVGRTSRQLDALLQGSLTSGQELKVEALLNAARRDSEIQRVCRWANDELRRGRTVTIFTSRAICSDKADSFLDAGEVIMSSLCEVVRRIEARPGFVVAKGGITSIEVARSALAVEEADVLGQVLGGVPVWRLGEESRWPGIPYVVFPGNVGDDHALCDTVRAIQGDRGGRAG